MCITSMEMYGFYAYYTYQRVCGWRAIIIIIMKWFFALKEYKAVVFIIICVRKWYKPKQSRKIMDYKSSNVAFLDE